MRLRPAAAAIVLTTVGCGGPSGDPSGPGTVTDEVLARAVPDGDWLTYGGSYAEDRFSPLDQITLDNVAELGLVWSYDFELRGGVETTPLVLDGVIYATGPWSVVHAIDARTGQRLWRHDPGVPRQRGRLACCDVVNRGAALYEGKVFVGTIDGRLVALDAETGRVEWETLTVDPDLAYTITGAPRVVEGLVVIGNGGAEYGVRGYVSAYDADDGALVWRTYTVPGNPADGFESEALARAAETWNGEWWTAGGGGTAWDAIIYDPELELLYIGTGNGSPWSRHLRSPGGGDNLFLASVLAVRPATGEYVWHYQTTPGDHWDYTATQPLMLADLEFDGALRRVIMQAPKNGFFYVLDAETGEFLSGQPYVTLNWADGIDVETGRPVERSEAVYDTEYALITPMTLGGHNFQPMAFHPETELVYLPVQEAWTRRASDPDWTFSGVEIRGDTLVSAPWNTATRGASAGRPASGSLVAWDPKAQESRWQVPLAGFWNGGVLATGGGLVFHGGGDGRFVAYDAATGESLWVAATRIGIIGSPVTYTVDGVQHVTVAAGWGGATGRSSSPYGEAADFDQRGRLFTFALGGSAEMPMPRRERPLYVPELELPTDAAALREGYELYSQYCVICHGGGGGSEGGMPNLQRATRLTHDNFEGIVLEGMREEEGMPSYRGLLSPEEVTLIQAYVVSRARAAVRAAETAEEEDPS